MNKSVTLLSHFINNSTPCYGGQTNFHIHNESSTKCGITCNSQKWSFGNHFGTHIDLPKHFDNSGRALESYSACEWIFTKPFLLDLPTPAGVLITPNETFNVIPAETDFLIIRTGFEKMRQERVYWENNPGIDPTLASWLRKHVKNVRAIGFDFISLTAYQNREIGRVAHQAFLQIAPQICIVEDMKLQHLSSQPQKIVIAPLLIEGADGSPVTIFSFN